MRRMSIVEWGKPLQEIELPTPEPGGEEILVEVESCGVCHSDVHLWEGHLDLGEGRRINMADRLNLPFAPGHEIVGRVKAVGPNADAGLIGGSYIVYPWIGCGACAVCRRGDEHMCDAGRWLGVRTHGGFGDHVIVPGSRYLVPYDDLPKEVACTFACSGITALSALKKAAGIAPDEWLMIVGAGGVGGSAIQLAGTVVGSKLLVADIDPAKREFALERGADAALDNSHAEAAQEALRLCGGGVAAAIDFVGSPKTVQFGIDSLRRGGRLIVVGMFGGAVTLPTLTFPSKLLKIEGSLVGSLDDLKEVVALARAGAVRLLPVTTRPRSCASEVLVELQAGAKGVGRTVLVGG